MDTKYHIDKKIIINNKTKFKNLYSWSINELDEYDRLIDKDYVPWRWDLHFRAKDISVREEISITKSVDTTAKSGENESSDAKETQSYSKKYILANLTPGYDGDHFSYCRSVRYMMFGCSREIKDFRLQILSLNSENENEYCKALGWVKYTYRDDEGYRNTQDDCIYFRVKVKPSTFARYIDQISDGMVDDLMLRVGRVAGFYAEWSPLTQTSEIKVLAPGDEQKFEDPEDLNIKPHRLGDIGDISIYINSRRELRHENKISEDDVKNIESNSINRSNHIIEDNRRAPSSKSTKMPPTISRGFHRVGLALSMPFFMLIPISYYNDSINYPYWNIYDFLYNSFIYVCIAAFVYLCSLLLGWVIAGFIRR